jgi:hypothetical protein
VNSDAEEALPLLAPDGKTLFFSRFLHEKNVGGRYSGLDIWQSQFDGNKWSKADNQTLPINNKNNNAVVGISADGKILYLLNASPSRHINGIYFSKKIKGNWTTPELIPIEGLSHEGFIGFHISPEFDVILLSMNGSDSKGQEDLYACTKDGNGKWSKPKNLGTSINTAGFEISPFLSRDKKRLYFSSDGHAGKGDADIFYAERLYDSWDLWSIPKNLGDRINLPSFDAYFSMQNDSIGFFTSNRGNRNADIYQVKFVREKNIDQESINKMIEEANTILTDLKDPNSNKTTIIFKDESAILSDQSKSELIEFVGRLKTFSSKYTIEIQGYYQQEKTNDPVLTKRIEEVRNYIVLLGTQSSISISRKPSESKLESPRYVIVTAKAK